MNFIKLRLLIASYEHRTDKEKTDFYKQLIQVANQEINIKQTDVRQWF